MSLESSETKNRRGSGVIDCRSLPILMYTAMDSERVTSVLLWTSNDRAYDAPQILTPMPLSSSKRMMSVYPCDDAADSALPFSPCILTPAPFTSSMRTMLS